MEKRQSSSSDWVLLTLNGNWFNDFKQRERTTLWLFRHLTLTKSQFLVEPVPKGCQSVMTLKL